MTNPTLFFWIVGIVFCVSSILLYRKVTEPRRKKQELKDELIINDFSVYRKLRFGEEGFLPPEVIAARIKNGRLKSIDDCFSEEAKKKIEEKLNSDSMVSCLLDTVNSLTDEQFLAYCDEHGLPSVFSDRHMDLLIQSGRINPDSVVTISPFEHEKQIMDTLITFNKVKK